VSFGEQLLDARVAARLSLRDLGQAVGLSAIYISDLERGNRRAPSAVLIERLATHLHIDPLPLLRAALEEREAVELPLRSAAQRELGLALAREWEDMTPEQLEDVRAYLSETTHHKQQHLEGRSGAPT
jgi:transcriptional regulator with XRE-family HTH domain